MKLYCKYSLFYFILLIHQNICEKYEKSDIEYYKNKVISMFYHAYDGYLNHAYPYDELQPLTCDGVDTWGSYSLTLIDSLDTLLVMKNYTEFNRVVEILQKNIKFNDDINVSVFESNIRVLGGLLSAHLLSNKAKVLLNPEWPCSGPLLDMAITIADKLLPAFNTSTGMPFGTVNLARGVNPNETPITCTACVTTYILEFGTLSRLTGDARYEEAALKAIKALDSFKSSIGLVSDHINTSNGKWIGSNFGIGAGIDSYFEYLFKGSVLLESPQLLKLFKEYYSAINKYNKQGDWYMWVNMDKGFVTLPVQQSLETFWPGLQTLYGDIEPAYRTILNYYEVWNKYGALPEFYNIQKAEPVERREGYPLRPELIESTLYMYRATKDPILLNFGKLMVDMIEKVTKTQCGYATIKNVLNHQLDNRMESFYLSETLKYLYLLFDEDHFLNNPQPFTHQFPSNNQQCVLGTGYIFNTEAHPIDFAALKCCQKRRSTKDEDLLTLLNLADQLKSSSEKNFVPEKPGNWSEMECKSQTYYLKLMKLGQIFSDD